MKRLLSFTIFSCFIVTSSFAVQQEEVKSKNIDHSIKMEKVKEKTIDNSRTSKKTIVTARRASSKSTRQFNGMIGHAIKKVSHRELIDRRKRIAGNY